MNKKILFFIDGWFLNFAVAKFLQEVPNFEFFVIYDVDKLSRKFYESQKLVKFEQIWFLTDSININSKIPNESYLKNFEKKFNINLWEIVYMDREFNSYNRFYNFSYYEILKILETTCKFFEEILEKSKPDFLSIMLTTSYHQELLRQMCKAKGIKILMLNSARLRDRMIISQEGNILDDNRKSSDKISHSDINLKEFFQEYNSFKELEEFKISNFESHIKDRYFSLLKFFITPIQEDFKKRYYNYGKTKPRILRDKFFHLLRKKYRKWFIDRNLSKVVDDKSSYIYFPLQMEPERVLLIGSKYFTNQISVINNIAKSIPMGYKLFVKEHPIMSIWGWRETNFYKQILSLSNVNLIHPSISSDQIIKKSSLVITIAGTAAQEAAFHGVPAITFTDQIYSSLPSIFKLDKIENLPNLIRKALSTKVDPQSLEEFVKILEENSFDFNLVRITSDFSYRFGFKGLNMDAELPEDKIKKFLSDYDSSFKELALEHLKKINKF